MFESTKEVESLYLLLKGELPDEEREFLRELQRTPEWETWQRIKYLHIKRRCFPRDVPARHAWDETVSPAKVERKWKQQTWRR